MGAFAAAFGGSGGYDFGANSSETSGGTNSTFYKSQPSNGFSQLAIIAAALVSIVFFIKWVK